MPLLNVRRAVILGPLLAFYVPLVLITLGYVVIFIWLRKKLVKRSNHCDETRLPTTRHHQEMKTICPPAKRLSKVS